MIVTDSPVFSPDSKHMAYTLWNEGKVFVVADGKEGPKVVMASFRVAPGQDSYSCDGVSVTGGNPVFSPDSSHVAYAARERRQVVCDVGCAADSRSMTKSSILPRSRPTARWDIWR